MKPIDVLLMNYFQKFSDWAQEWFGPTNFFWARAAFFFLTFGCFAMVGIDVVAQSKKGFVVFPILLMCGVMLLTYKLSIGICKAEKWCRKHPNLLNEELKDSLAIRLKSLTLCAACIILMIYKLFESSEPANLTEFLEGVKFFMYGLVSTLNVIMCYFNSCTPKPLKKEKAKALIESLALQKPQFAS